MGQNYANQGEYMMLLDTHNKAMQLIRGGRTTRGIGDLMSDPGWVNTEYVKFGGTDLGVGGESASLSDILTGRNRNTAAANINTGQLSAADQAARTAAMSQWTTNNPLWAGSQGMTSNATVNAAGIPTWVTPAPITGARTGLLDPNAVTATNIGGLFDY